MRQQAPHSLLTTATGSSLKTAGTWAYMAPEQKRGEKPDHRADVYALGVLAFHLLTGTYPDAFASQEDALKQLPQRWRSVVERCLRRSPDQRYPNCNALRSALQAAQQPQ